MEQLMYCKLEHGWKTRNRSSVEEVIVYRLESSEESATLPDSGITLYPPENDEIETEEQMQCTLTAVCKNPPYNMNITAVDILSSAKTIELYSDRRDYIETVGGMRLNIEAQNGNRVFLAQHTFEPPVSSCMLKFLSRHRKEELYLHSVQISLSQITSHSTDLGYGSINLPEVRNMLGQSDTQMSDGAKALFNAMEAFQKNKSSAANTMFGGMMGNMMMSQMGASASATGAPNMAALAGMFASMGMGRNARQSRGAEASDGLARSSGHSTNKNSTQVNGDHNMSNDSSCNDSEQSNGISQNSALDEDSHNMILAMLPQLTQLFETKLLEMEKRICSRLSREVALSEQRLAKLILERTGGSRSASIDEAELDLD